MKNFNFFEKLWEHSRTLRRVGLVLVMCLMAIPQLWAGDWFTDGMWQVYGWDGSSNGWHWTGIGKNNDCELGVMTSSRSITIKGVGANTNQDSGGDVKWVGVHCFYLDGTDAWLDLIYRGKTGNNKYWDSEMLWDLSIDKTVTPGNYYFGMDFWMKDDGSNYNKNYRQIKWTIPGFVDAPASKSFGTAPTNSEAETTISFTHYGNALTTGNCSITGTNQTEFEVRSISESGVTVVFKPSSNGSKSATLTINDGTGLNYSSVSISLSGTAGTSGTVTRLYFNDYEYSGAGDWDASGAKYRFTCTYTSGVVTRYNMTKCDNTEHTYYADVDIRDGKTVSIDRYNPASPYVTWNTATPTSPALSSTNPYAKSTNINGAYASNHPYNDVTGGMFYYDNSESGFENYLYLLVGHDYAIASGSADTYSDKYALSNISNTKLYYNNASKSWHDATYYAVIGNTSSSPSWGTNWGSSTIPTKGGKGYTAAYTSLFGLLSGSTYLASSPSKTGGTMTISKIDGLPNCTITVAAKVKAIDGSYTAGASKGALSASSKLFTGATSTGTNSSSSTSVSIGATASSFVSAYTCTKCTLEVTSTADGYTFRGWYNAAGTKLSDDAQYTGYLPKGDATVYAYFEEDTYTITYNNMTGATNPGSNPSSYTVNSSTITLANPSKSGYGFGGWYSDEDCTTRVTTIPNGSTGDKTLYAKWLDIHEPGKYTTAIGSGGYGQTLSTYSDSLYERYGLYKNTESYLWAGTKPSKKTDSQILGQVGVATGKAIDWGYYHFSACSNGDASATAEFPALNPYGTLKNDGSYVILCVKGYESFNIIGSDNNTSSAYIQVKINGVDKTRSKSTSTTVRRYYLSPNSVSTIELTGISSNSSQLWGFSLKPATPTISAGPSDEDAEYAVGDAATALSVSATPVVAGATLSYQWYVNTTNAATVDNEHKITGATSYSYTPPTTSAGTTYYYCVVSEAGCNDATSAVSGAIVVAASTYSITYECYSATSGCPATNPATGQTALPDPLPTVTKNGYTFGGWYTDNTLETSAVAGATLDDDVTLYAKWTCTTPTISNQPEDATVCKDVSSPTLSVTASANGGSLSYQWYVNTTNAATVDDDHDIDGATSDSYDAPTSAVGTKYYYCVVTNTTGSCSATSDIATVTVTAPTAISSHPSSIDDAVVGEEQTLTVSATGTGTLTYQWWSCTDGEGTGAAKITSGSNPSGYTSATLSFTPGSAGTTYYYCVVGGDCGSSQTTSIVSITAKTMPAQYTVSGTASICSGSNTNITLSNSETGVSYQLYKDGVADGDPENGTGDAIVWSVSDEATYTVKAVGDADYWERAMSSSATVSFKTEVSISTQPTTAVAATESVNFTLGSGMVVAGTGTKSYKWYSYTSSGGEGEDEIDGATSATYTTSKAAAGAYYYKVGVTADCGDEVKSNMITVTVSEGPCFTMTAKSDASSDGTLSHNESISVGSDNCVALTGGTAKYVDVDGSANMTVQKLSSSKYGWYFNHDKDQIVITLSAGYSLQVGSVITLSGYANGSGKGIKMNGVTLVTTGGSEAFTDASYTVKVADTDLVGANELILTRVSGSGAFLYTISISGCDYCEPITPTLSYSKTTFWLDEETDSLWCSPTLDKAGSTGAVTYSSSDPSIVWVGTYGSIFAQKRGTATITASIAADGTHCASEATCKIIVKSIECGENIIAGITRKSGSGTVAESTEGAIYGSCGINVDNDGKISSGKYIYITLSSGNYFRDGDKVAVSISKVSDQSDKGMYICAGTTTAGTLVGSMAYEDLSTSTPNVITLSNVPDNTSSITLHRTAGDKTQNHYVDAIKVKRYTCPDILVFNDAENDQLWSTADNWLGKAGQGTGLPKDTDRVYIKKSVTIGATTAVAGRVHVTNGAVMTVAKNVTMGKIDVETGSTLHVAKDGESGITLSLKTLHLVGGFGTVNDETKYDMPRVYIDPASTIEKTNDVVNFDIAVNNRSYYPFALPFDVPLVTYGTNAVDYANSYFALYSNYGLPAGQYAIKTYNGQKRANSGSSSANWEQVSVGTTLKAGKGYALCAMPADASGYNEAYAVIRFPMVVDGAWTIEGEQGSVEIDDKTVTKNVIPVTAYKKEGTGEGTGDKTPKKNIGWNLLGVPFMSCYQTSADMYSGVGAAAIIQGKLNYETNQWDDKDNVRYVTVPNSDFTEYAQYNIVDDDTKLLPGWCFFVQIETSGNLTFLSAKEAQNSDLPYAAPRREQANMPTLKTGIILSGNDASDKTTILVSDKYSAAEYEINADLEKMFGEDSYTLATYSLSGSTRLAYNAMSNADAANIIPIGYRAPADGDYTFSINPRYVENGAFESVNLIDYETGIVTDLMSYSYTFSTERTQNDTRFALNVTKRQDTTTDIENGATDANGVRKVLINKELYIILDGKMYDATGKAVK